MDRKSPIASSRWLISLPVLLIAITGCGGNTSSSSDQASAASAASAAGTANAQAATIVMSGAPATEATVGNSYYFQPSPASSDTPLTYTIDNKPAWTAFDPTSGALSGTPSASDVGDSAEITINAYAGANAGTVGPFIVHVKPKNTSTVPVPNIAPTIAGTPATSIVAGNLYSFTPTATDTDGDSLSYSIVNWPSWATFSTATGQLSGTPPQAGTFANILISVSDGHLAASLAAFSIQVTAPVASTSGSTSSTGSTSTSGSTSTTGSTSTAGSTGTGSSTGTTATANTAPTITGTPATTVLAGSAYSFKPTASDSDGDAISFSIQNMPSWATFNIATGQLTGTPTAANVGSYPNIVIAVSDGTTSTSLAAFTITVTAPPSSGSVTLSWTAPTQNTDGTALTNLAGYQIYFGTSSSALTQTITITNVGLATYVIDNLAAGTWYFAVKSYNTSAVESDLSGIVSTTIT